jgi:hypothetical protein
VGMGVWHGRGRGGCYIVVVRHRDAGALYVCAKSGIGVLGKGAWKGKPALLRGMINMRLVGFCNAESLNFHGVFLSLKTCFVFL